MLDSGEVASFEELASRYDVDRSYIGRIPKLATLAPDIVEAILEDNKTNGLSLERLKKPFSLRWDEQREYFDFLVQ